MTTAVQYLCLLLCLSFTPSLQNVSESEPLMRFKRSVNITKGDLDSWRTGTDPCNGKWFGIYCQKGQTVSGIHVTRLGLAGIIHIDDLKDLPNLRTIRLDNNLLSGPLPPFFKLHGLKSLLLSNNSFAEEIADDFFKDMPQLKRVFLDNNHFTGKIPASVMQITGLEELHLQGNQFSGEIPPLTDGNMILKSLDLSNNNLEGEIPKSISERKNLQMNFQGNQKLCGQPLNIKCDDKPSPSGKDPNEVTGKPVFMVILFLLIFLILVAILTRWKKKKQSEFRMLGKDHLSNRESVEVRVPESVKKPVESTKKRSNADGSSKKGSNHHGKGGPGGGGGGMGDIIMVNSEKGSFGLPDLMKAAAEVLGNGSLGSAYKAVMANGLSVVVKRIRDMNKLARDAFDVELQRFGKLRHPNVLTPLAYHYRREEKLVVSEYMPKSSLLYVLHGDRGISHSELTWPTRLKIIQGVARGMQFLHEEFASYDLPHGNLKSKFAQTQQVSPKSDVYCLGIILLEVMTGKFPSQYLSNGKGGTDIVEWVQTSVAQNKEEELIDPEIASNTDSLKLMVELLQIGAACIASNPDDREKMKETVTKIEQITI
ncbi:hypothetical protein N665_0134s0017 [Sinapis alba]|nr:hypothetical protein N665_0134s0017 [Sinapis alba]